MNYSEVLFGCQLKMLITKLFKHKHVHVKKKMQSKLDQCCAVIVAARYGLLQSL